MLLEYGTKGINTHCFKVLILGKISFD